MTCSILASAAITTRIPLIYSGTRWAGFRAAPGFLRLAARFSSRFAVWNQAFSSRNLRIPEFIAKGQRTLGVTFATTATGKSLHEFTVNWCRGASIGWHSDDNRPYLKQRDFAAVCYLNSHGKDFKGGVFRFKDGDPSTVVPIAGDVLIYTADDRNVHSVDEVLDGERLTLTLWFTRNRAHDEDAKLISLLSQNFSNHEKGKRHSFFPSPASNSMYWFSDGLSGFDLRCARIKTLGFRFFSLKHQELSNSDVAADPLELLNMPLRLAKGDEIFDKEFLNSLHGLQVIQFYHLKASELMASRTKKVDGTESTEPHHLDEMNGLELVLPCDHQLAEKVLGSMTCDDKSLSFSWDAFKLADTRWEEYMFSLYEELLMLIPTWVFHQTIFLAPPEELSCNQFSGLVTSTNF